MFFDKEKFNREYYAKSIAKIEFYETFVSAIHECVSYSESNGSNAVCETGVQALIETLNANNMANYVTADTRVTGLLNVWNRGGIHELYEDVPVENKEDRLSTIRSINLSNLETLPANQKMRVVECFIAKYLVFAFIPRNMYRTLAKICASVPELFYPINEHIKEENNFIEDAISDNICKMAFGEYGALETIMQNAHNFHNGAFFAKPEPMLEVWLKDLYEYIGESIYRKNVEENAIYAIENVIIAAIPPAADTPPVEIHVPQDYILEEIQRLMSVSSYLTTDTYITPGFGCVLAATAYVNDWLSLYFIPDVDRCYETIYGTSDYGSPVGERELNNIVADTKLGVSELTETVFGAGNAEGLIYRMRNFISQHQTIHAKKLEMYREWASLLRTYSKLSSKHVGPLHTFGYRVMRTLTVLMELDDSDMGAALNELPAVTRPDRPLTDELFSIAFHYDTRCALFGAAMSRSTRSAIAKKEHQLGTSDTYNNDVAFALGLSKGRNQTVDLKSIHPWVHLSGGGIDWSIWGFEPSVDEILLAQACNYIHTVRFATDIEGSLASVINIGTMRLIIETLGRSGWEFEQTRVIGTSEYPGFVVSPINAPTVPVLVSLWLALIGVMSLPEGVKRTSDDIMANPCTLAGQAYTDREAAIRYTSEYLDGIGTIMPIAESKYWEPILASPDSEIYNAFGIDTIFNDVWDLVDYIAKDPWCVYIGRGVHRISGAIREALKDSKIRHVLIAKLNMPTMVPNFDRWGIEDEFPDVPMETATVDAVFDAPLDIATFYGFPLSETNVISEENDTLRFDIINRLVDNGHIEEEEIFHDEEDGVYGGNTSRDAYKTFRDIRDSECGDIDRNSLEYRKCVDATCINDVYGTRRYTKMQEKLGDSMYAASPDKYGITGVYQIKYIPVDTTPIIMPENDAIAYEQFINDFSTEVKEITDGMGDVYTDYHVVIYKSRYDEYTGETELSGDRVFPWDDPLSVIVLSRQETENSPSRENMYHVFANSIKFAFSEYSNKMNAFVNTNYTLREMLSKRNIIKKLSLEMKRRLDIALTKVPKHNNAETFELVISSRPADFLRASACQPWMSCHNPHGINKKCPTEYANEAGNNYIAYLAKSEFDPEWLGRVYILEASMRSGEPILSIQRIYTQKNATYLQSIISDAVFLIVRASNQLPSGNMGSANLRESAFLTPCDIQRTHVNYFDEDPERANAIHTLRGDDFVEFIRDIASDDPTT